jgi:hypothetical protein
LASGAVIGPVYITLSDLDTKGMTLSSILIGEMLITALSAFHPELDNYQLVPKLATTVPLPRTPPPGEKRGEMHPERMGLGVSDMTIQPALVLNTFAGNAPVGKGQLQFLKQLAEMGESAAPAFLGDIMLRKLAAMHPDAFAPFPNLSYQPEKGDLP